MIHPDKSLSRVPIVFLDYDGAMHPDEAYLTKIGLVMKAPGHAFMENAKYLIEALDPYPEVKIVLSTSWVRMLRFSRAKYYLPEVLQERVIGATWHSEMKRELGNHDPFEHMTRFQQIHQFVERHQVKHWVAIDDDAKGWDPEYRDNLVHTPPMEGLSDPEALQSLKDKLNVLSAANRLHKLGM